MGADLQVRIPPKFRAFEKPSRYKVAKGGRGGGKTHTFSKLLILRVLEEQARVLCCREIQNSIDESVKQVLADQIVDLNLGYHFDVQATGIYAHAGGGFGFRGLRTNIDSLKSWENAKYAWIAEATKISKRSMRKLVPTIRAPGSEIWIEYNPELEEDFIHQEYWVNPQPDSVLVEVNWRDNPWFPAELEKERLALLARDPVAYENVYEGKCLPAVEGAIFSHEMAWLAEHQRITSVPYERGYAVHTAWDFGRSDFTSIIFFQRVGFEWRIFDHLRDNQRDISSYVEEIQKKREEGNWVWGTHYVPHDAAAKTILSNKSIEMIMRSSGLNTLRIPRAANMAEINQGIDAVRRGLKSTTYIDKQRCSDLLTSLRRYRYKVNDRGETSREPAHDEFSHDCDAMRCLFVAPAGLATASGARPIERVRYTVSS